MEPNDRGLSVLSGLDDPVRRRLYEFVAGHGEPVGRDEAAAAAGIGRPLAAYHLDKLVTLGLLTASYQRPASRRGPGAGRPAKLYARAAGEFTVAIPPRAYELAARLLAAAVEADGGGTSRTALNEAARQYGTAAGVRSQRGGPDRRRTGERAEAVPAEAVPAEAAQAEAEQAEAALRERGFEPWRDDGGAIRLRNCPFHHLAAEYRELICGMNLALIDGLVAGLGADDLHPVLDPRPGCCCVAIETGGPAGDPSTAGAS